MNAKNQTAAADRKIRLTGFLIKPKEQTSPFREISRFEKQIDEDFGIEVDVATDTFHLFTVLQNDREDPTNKEKQRWIRCRWYRQQPPADCEPNDLVQISGSLQSEQYTDRKTGEEKVARFVNVDGIETIWRRGAKKHEERDGSTYDGTHERADLPNDSGEKVNPATAAQVANVRAAAVEKKAEEAAEAVKATAKARRNVETLKNSAGSLSPEAHAAALKAAREKLQTAEENEKRTASQLASLKRQAAIA